MNPIDGEDAMRTKTMKSMLNAAVMVASLLLFGAASAFGQAQISLTAGESTAALPDGSAVSMWGYSCTAATGGTCVKLNPNAAGWSPVVITVPAGQDLQISLTNTLAVPTSLAIVGQLGAALGTSATSDLATNWDHSQAQGQVTWPIVDPTTTGTPPVQGDRVRSFSTEIAAGAATSSPLVWTKPRAGTYLIESGTHPSIQGPMGLYGILVVTTAPAGGSAGTAYPGVAYSADVPFLLSEIDPVQNAYVQSAVHTAGFSETAVWSGKAGACGDITSATHTCYPPAVNYTPLYYLVNGVAFDKTNPTGSLFSVAPTSGVTGSVLVRLVN